MVKYNNLKKIKKNFFYSPGPVLPPSLPIQNIQLLSARQISAKLLQQ